MFEVALWNGYAVVVAAAAATHRFVSRPFPHEAGIEEGELRAEEAAFSPGQLDSFIVEPDAKRDFNAEKETGTG